MFEKLFGRFFKKKGDKAAKKKAPTPAKKEAVNESVSTEKSALNEEAPENSLSASSPSSDAQPLDDKPPSGLINMNAGLEKQTETETESLGLTLSMRWVTAYRRW